MLTHELLMNRAVESITYRELLEEFRYYLIVKWHWLGLPSPTELQMDASQYLQYGGDRKLLKGFRGVAKSWITASFCEWRWLRNKDLRILVVSGNQKKSDEISIFIRQSIEGFPPLQPLRWAEWEKQHVRWGIQQFNIKGAPPDIAPSCKSASIASMITGSRAHLIIGDDIETPNNSATVESRELLLAQLGEFESVLLPGGEIILLGTPQSEESVYSEVETRGYSVMTIPIRVPEPEEIHLYKQSLCPTLARRYTLGEHGQPSEPLRFPEEELLKKEAGMTRAAWRLQMMLDTSLADANRYPLKLKDLVIAPLDISRGPMTIVWSQSDKHRVTGIPTPGFTGDFMVGPMFTGDDWKPYEKVFMMIDPSGQGSDETSWCIFGTLAGRYFVLDFGGTTKGYGEETLELITQKAKTFSVKEIVYENNFGDGMFGEILGQFMKFKYPVAITPRRATGQKELRILNTLEPVIRSHKLVIDHGAMSRDCSLEDKNYSLAYQLTHLTKDRGCLKHDDRLDCLAHGVAHVMSVAGTNSEESLALAKERDLESSLQSILKGTQMFSLQEAGVIPRGHKFTPDFLKKKTKFFFNKL